MVPKPIGTRLPMLAIGRAGQSIEWLATNMDGWIWHQIDFQRLGEVVASWRAAISGGHKVDTVVVTGGSTSGCLQTLRMRRLF
jgi:alkanesulfonate monooxygenase SsuD/methylene tetrahydromethanopterin reductase-like flavin-dependent oxidoreductase (luciferase family)